tara:strand:- start:240 stop:413 length:174 start_codon:yes stop_codon:yes gene_type:complete
MGFHLNNAAFLRELFCIRAACGVETQAEPAVLLSTDPSQMLSVHHADAKAILGMSWE